MAAASALLASAAAAQPAAQPAATWAGFATPAPGPAQAIGPATAGCLAGGVRLPDEGPGFRTIRRSRNRHWGHPATIAFVQDLAAAAQRAGLPTLYVGDLAQPRGGPMPFGHASHQTGLDADIWFNLDAKSERETSDFLENPRLPSLVLAGPPPRLDAAAWRPGHLTLLRLAATHPAVDRVLVNPAIKQHLCATLPPDQRGWIRKVRPWWGHDAHMHVHLACPEGSPACRNPNPIPPGDGCDASLLWWFEQPPVPARPAAPSAPRPGLPAACLDLARRP